MVGACMLYIDDRWWQGGKCGSSRSRIVSKYRQTTSAITDEVLYGCRSTVMDGAHQSLHQRTPPLQLIIVDWITDQPWPVVTTHDVIADHWPRNLYGRHAKFPATIKSGTEKRRFWFDCCKQCQQTSASAERSFICVRRIRTYLRPTMSESTKHLNLLCSHTSVHWRLNGWICWET